MPTRDETEKQLALENARQRDEDLARLISSPWGRRLVRWILYDLCKLEVTSYDSNIKDGLCALAHQARISGRQDVGIKLKIELERVDIAGVVSMVAENAHAVQSERARLMEDTGVAQ
jgi:hypothetical protein